MKRSYVLSALVTLTCFASLACGGWSRPDYYVFSAFNRNQMGETFTARTLQFWKDYTGEKLSTYDMSGLVWVDPDEFENSQNTLIKTALQRNDREILDYLRLLTNYLKQCQTVDEDDWAYPTKQQIANRNTQLQNLNSRARAYSGTRLRPQYALLIMRTLMLQGDTKGILSYWKSHGSQMPESVYKDMLRDIYAGAVLRNGDKDEACRIYAELGDMRSIKWIMRDKRNLANIQAEYSHNPNNPTLVYLVQDFVNNASSSLSDLTNPYYELDNATEDLKALRNQVSQFTAFALKVVKDGKTNSPALWQAAAGYCTHLLGDHSTAISLLDKAANMKGTQRMRDNARTCRIVASVPLMKNNNNDFNRFVSDLKWLTECESKEEVLAYNGNHYSEVLANLAYDRMPPRLRDLGLPNTATALIGWMSAHEQFRTEHAGDENYYYNTDYATALDNLTADEMITYQSFFNSKLDNPLDKFLRDGLSGGPDNNYFSDRIGTKLIREGRFEQAISYLEAVPLDYYATQAISSYMARRDYHVEQWFKRQRGGRDETPISVTENQRLQFCRDVIDRQKRINQSNGTDRARLLYDLATYFFEASYAGNCWYISRYGQSVSDTVCYRNELDFVAKAVELLQQAQRLSATDPQLHYKTLYAAAYIPFGEEFKTPVWDDNYNLSFNYNTNCYWYKSMSALQAYAEKNKSDMPGYLSRCDTYRRFARGEY